MKKIIDTHLNRSLLKSITISAEKHFQLNRKRGYLFETTSLIAKKA
jgi:hypothetical protein